MNRKNSKPCRIGGAFLLIITFTVFLITGCGIEDISIPAGSSDNAATEQGSEEAPAMEAHSIEAPVASPPAEDAEKVMVEVETPPEPEPET